jgi:hypothetical protein
VVLDVSVGGLGVRLLRPAEGAIEAGSWLKVVLPGDLGMAEGRVARVEGDRLGIAVRQDPAMVASMERAMLPLAYPNAGRKLAA